MVSNSEKASSGESLSPAGTMVPRAPLSFIREAGDMIFISGQLSFDADHNIVGPGDVHRQTCVAIERIERLLATLDLDLTAVVQTHISLVDRKAFSEMNAAYKEYFHPPYPARVTVAVHQLMVEECLVEVEAVAWRGNK